METNESLLLAKRENGDDLIESLMENIIKEEESKLSDELNAEQLEIFRNEAKKRILDFLKRDSDFYNSIVAKALIASGIGGDRGFYMLNNDEEGAKALEKRPDILRRIYDVKNEPIPKFLKGVTPAFLLEDEDEDDVFAEENKTDDFSDIQKEKIENISKEIKDEIIHKDKEVVDSTNEAMFGKTDEDMFIYRLNDRIYGRKDLFLKIFKKNGGRVIKDVIEFFDKGVNKGKPSKWFTIPCEMGKYNDFRERYGFDYPEREILEIMEEKNEKE